MSYNSTGLLDDNLVFTGQCGIEKATVINGKKWKKFGLQKEDGRYLTGHTKISEFIWCRAFCITKGVSTIEMAETIGELIDGDFTQSAVSNRFNKIKRFYLWVCLAFLKEAKYYPGWGARANSPYRNAQWAVIRWIAYLQDQTKNPNCNACKDTGLTLSKGNSDWDYCTCKLGKQRKKALLNY